MLSFRATIWCDQVGADAVQRAIHWAKIFESHARYVYEEAEQTPTTALASKIQSGKVPNEMTVRAIGRPKWSRLTDDVEIESALKDLERAGWLRVKEHKPMVGRPSRMIVLRPDLNHYIE